MENLKGILIEYVTDGEIPANIRRAIKNKYPVLILNSCRKNSKMSIDMACYNMNETMRKTAINTMLKGIREDFGGKKEIKVTQLI